MPIPRGSALGSKSGILGRPVELENLTQIGVEGLLKWGAMDNFFTSSDGVKVPVRVIPFAWPGIILIGNCEYYLVHLTWTNTWI